MGENIENFLNFSKDLIQLLPVNVQHHSDLQQSRKNHKTHSLSEKSIKKSKNSASTTHLPSTETTRAQTSDELKQRLQDKLSEFKDNRASKKPFNQAEQAAREQKKALKRQMKKNKQRSLIHRKQDGQNVPVNRGNLQKSEKSSSEPFNKKQKVKENIEEGVEFGKFDYVTGNEAAAQKFKKAGEDKTSKLEGKASKELLKSAEGLKRRMQFLEKNNPEGAKKLKTEHQWNKALAQSEGKKIQDDPDKIKKSLKERQRQKQKSKSKWKTKTDEVEASKQEKQDKRTENIQSRIKNKKARKINSLKKRGRIL